MAAYGLAQAVAQGEDPSTASETLIATRPTAVNLKVGLDAVLPHCSSASLALEAARAHDDAEVAASERIGELGADLIAEGALVGTHCNAGWLAAQDWGTALSPVYKAAEAGKRVRVSADETRLRLQGSRLTAWELVQAGIDHQIVADGATVSLLRRGLIDLVITGADRIAANGDVANKIGTYPLALAAKAHGVPFYVAAPTTTIDPDIPTGDDIPIEERSESEVLYASGLAADGALMHVRLAP
jgi:S-methyl-5-thioribose-1-phosphate isomerase